jgi:NADPH:quinone reductase-like Zn-dependent oxidoreductase
MEATTMQQKQMRAVFTNPGADEPFVLRETAVPVPFPNQALVKVTAFSLNQGETRTALDATHAYISGWDFAGVIEQAAADGSTPPRGARVFGFIQQGAWAHYITAPGWLMAEIPDGITYAQAATLPVAGLTALACLQSVGNLAHSSVLITGAAGGVGRFLCQLVAHSGARVFAISRRPELQFQLEKDGVQVAGIFTSMEQAKEAGAYDVVFDSVGGDSLATALLALSPNGICVNYGNSSRQPTTFNVRSSHWPFTHKQCIWLGREVPANCTPLLLQLAGMVKCKQLHTSIHAELPWTDITKAAELLVQQKVNGKIVLNVVQ